MLNSVAGAILLLAKKSLIITVVNVVNAIVVLGMVLLWAKNVDEIALSWVVGDVFNTLLFILSAFLALREVGWRWADLGAAQAESAVSRIPRTHAPTGALQALDLLFELAERQQEARIYLPYQYPLTESRGLFTVMALQAAERERAERLKRAMSADDHARPEASGQPSRSDPQHQQAFDLLFKMAEQQRSAELIDRSHPQPRGGQDPYAG